eukprot:1677454-Rhodomonas_salina.3
MTEMTWRVTCGQGKTRPNDRLKRRRHPPSVRVRSRYRDTRIRIQIRASTSRCARTATEIRAWGVN